MEGVGREGGERNSYSMIDQTMGYFYMVFSNQLFYKNDLLANSFKNLVGYGFYAFIFRDKYFMSP